MITCEFNVFVRRLRPLNRRAIPVMRQDLGFLRPHLNARPIIVVSYDKTDLRDTKVEFYTESPRRIWCLNNSSSFLLQLVRLFVWPLTGTDMHGAVEVTGYVNANVIEIGPTV